MFLVLVFQDRNSVLETLDVLLLLVPALAGGLPVQMYSVDLLRFSKIGGEYQNHNPDVTSVPKSDRRSADLNRPQQTSLSTRPYMRYES